MNGKEPSLDTDWMFSGGWGHSCTFLLLADCASSESGWARIVLGPIKVTALELVESNEASEHAADTSDAIVRPVYDELWGA